MHDILSSTAVIEPAESPRLQCLRSLQIVDAPPDPALEALVRTAAALFDCPLALVTLVDGDRVRFKARHGTDLDGTPRVWSFCQHALDEGGLLVVGDAAEDPRFRELPEVAGPPRLRFYAGAPLAVRGQVLGMLCVLGHEPRTLDTAQRRALASLAGVASSLLEREAAVRAVELEVARLTHFLAASADFVWEADDAPRLLWTSPEAGRHLAAGTPAGTMRHDALLDGRLLDVWGEPVEPAVTLRDDLRRGAALHGRRYALRGPDGPRPFVVSALPVTGADGVLVGWRGRARDCLGEVQALQRLRSQDRRLDAIVRHVPGVLFDLAVEPGGRMRLRYANPAARALWGLAAQPHDVDGEVLLARVHADDRDALVAALQASARTGVDCRVEVRLAGEGGRLRSQAFVASPSYETGGIVVFRGYAQHVVGARRAGGCTPDGEAMRLCDALRSARVGVVRASAGDADLMSLDAEGALQLGLPARPVVLPRPAWALCIDPPFRAAALRALDEAHRGDGPARARFTVDGGRRELVLDVALDADGGGLLGLSRQVGAAA